MSHRREVKLPSNKVNFLEARRIDAMARNEKTAADVGTR